jgi:hypothetical protein
MRSVRYPISVVVELKVNFLTFGHYLIGAFRGRNYMLF